MGVPDGDHPVRAGVSGSGQHVGEDGPPRRGGARDVPRVDGVDHVLQRAQYFRAAW